MVLKLPKKERMMIWFFATLLGIGLAYLFLVIFGGLGEMFDLDGALDNVGIHQLFGIDVVDVGEVLESIEAVDDISGIADSFNAVDVTESFDASADVQGLGCMALAAFMAMFGGVGVVGILGERPLWIILLVGVAISYGVARIVVEVLKYVQRQQGNEAFSTQDFIGKPARVTINSASGKTGEVMVEADRRLKYPVKEINGVALSRGDTVTIVGIDGRYLKVEK
jgi:membrane protein implicated in regulation of membrane protease activity